MREALLKLWHETQPESVAEFYEIADQKILPEIRRECFQKGRQEGLRVGLQEGRQESMEGVAKRMISKGMVDSDIHVFTQLSLEEIAKLRNGAHE